MVEAAYSASPTSERHTVWRNKAIDCYRNVPRKSCCKQNQQLFEFGDKIVTCYLISLDLNISHAIFPELRIQRVVEQNREVVEVFTSHYSLLGPTTLL